MDSPLVSVIVITHNDEDLVPECIAALQRTTYDPVELIFVDNASTDGTVPYIREHAPEARVIVNEVGHGPGVGGNQGAEVAEGELLVHLNSDVFVEPDWLDLMTLHIREHPEIGILSATTLRPGEPVPSDRSPIALREVAAVPGCAAMFPRRAWDDLGGFDPNFFIYWLDTDICWRAWYGGWTVAEDLQAMVHHEKGGSTRGEVWAADQIRGCIYTHLKLMPWRHVALFALLMAAKTIRYLPSAPASELARAWTWNLGRLGRTLAERRRWAPARKRHGRELERRVVAHWRRQLREQRVPPERTIAA